MRQWIAGALVLGLVVPLAPAHGTTADPGGGSPTATAPVRSHRVTLLTGDVVRVEQDATGRTQAAVEQSAGPSSAFRVFERDGHTHVVPLPAQPYVDAGLLDPRLFDVTALVEQRYDDASTPDLPLIVEYRAARPGARAVVPAAAPAGARAGITLPSLDGRAVSQVKGNAKAFWSDVSGADRTGGRLLPRTSAQLTLDDGIERIWLDGRAEATLDRSVPSIGAPQAWSQGYDGSGVTVAVLDSGLDAAHPDFAGKVVAARSFTPDGGTADGLGHGTHVASTVVGSGAASGGSHRGVAPGARLMVGKVLGDEGFGQESWIVSGMEWAATSGATVVNLSLGSYPTDGSDPMSQAVDRLSASTGALFVIAAGNLGPSPRTVSAPAAADSALAVGNNRLDGTMNPSSSRGSRLIDNAIKPEISAPGTGIVAAYPGGGYRALSGTSMAAPHVAGSAAILAQRHPGWTGQQLKTALVASSVPLDGVSVWDQGAGRVAVDRAVVQTVQVSDGVLNLGYLDQDSTGDQLVRERTLTYRNDGTEPVTLTLRADVTDDARRPAPAGTITVTPATLTLSPGQSAPVTVRLDATGVASGQYAGRLVATGGPQPVTTALGFYRQLDLVDITVSLTDRLGRPAGGHVTLYNYAIGVFEPGGYIETGVPAGQTKTLRVPRATYSITATVSTYDASGRFATELTLVADPQRRLDRNGRLSLDARAATPVDVRTPRTSAAETVVLGWTRGRADGNVFVDSLLVLPEAGEVDRLSATPTAQVTDGRFDVYTSWHRAVPWLTARIHGQVFEPTYFAGSRRYEGTSRPPVADVGTSAAGQDLRGKVALLRELPGTSPADQVRAAAAAGAVLALVVPAQPGSLRATGSGLPIPAATLSSADGDRLRAQLRPGARLDLTGVVASPYTYDLTFHDSGRIPRSMRRTVRNGDLAQIDASYHADGAARQALITRFPTKPCACSLVRMFEQQLLPYRRTEYVSTGASVWSVALQGGLTSNLRASGLAYTAGRRYVEDWGRAPLAPRPAAGEASVRDGDTLRLRISPIADTGGHSGNSAGPSTGVLYRDGTRLADLYAGFGDIAVPADDSTYRLEVDTSNGAADGDRLSTSTHSAWTFRSGHADGSPAPLPLLSPDYDLPLSLGNAVDPRKPVPLTIRADLPGGTTARLASARIWVSYDDGATWQTVPANLSPDGTARAVLPAAGQAAHAALRVELTDHAGNSVDQTVVRAFRLATD